MKIRSRRGQTMVEYIIIVVLIAIALIGLVSLLGKSVGKKFAGATSALDSEAGQEAQQKADELGEDKLRDLKTDGTF